MRTLRSVKEAKEHPPVSEPTAALRLRLRTPVGAEGRPAWDELNRAQRAVSVGLQNGLADVLVHLRATGKGGQKRLATPAERKAGGVDPAIHYTKEELAQIGTILTDALRRTGLVEYVYASVAKRVASSEFAGEKLRRLVRGDVAYPVHKRPAIAVRSRNWKVTVETGTDDRKRRWAQATVELTSLWPKGGRVRLVSDRIYGRGLAGQLAVLRELEKLGYATAGGGWAKGAVTIRPHQEPGRPRRWYVILPYTPPAPEVDHDPEAVVAVNRGMANFLTVAVLAHGAVTFHYYRGGEIVAAKGQFLRRQRRILRDVSDMPKGKGRRYRYRALARMESKHRRVVDTAIWRAARFVQRWAESVGACVVVVEDFASPVESDYVVQWSDQARRLRPYIRRFPFADLKARVIDALTRRAGTAVLEVPGAYVSRICPSCGHESAENVARLPRAPESGETEDGRFACEACGFDENLDAVACLNLMIRAGGPGTVRKVRAATL